MRIREPVVVGRAAGQASAQYRSWYSKRTTFRGLFTGNIQRVVSKLEDAARWQAPGRLEDVRRFLNTWEHLARTRENRDHLPTLARDARGWKRRFQTLHRPSVGQLPELTALRMGLRTAIEDELDVAWLNAQLQAAALTVAVDGGGKSIRYVTAGEPTTLGDVLAIVVDAIADGSWERLKSCPDCQLVFFDRTRNGTKRWCQMSAREGGRACGSIAKVKSWRARKNGVGR